MKGMKLNFGLAIIMSLSALLGFSQANSTRIFTLSDTSEIEYKEVGWPEEIDSIVILKKYYDDSPDIFVYFDDDQMHLAYSEIQFENCRRTRQYWRNGQLKTNKNLGYDEFCKDLVNREEYYCENGQLILYNIESATCPFLSENNCTLSYILRFHCNGNKHEEYYRWGYYDYREGVYKSWDENGNLKMELFYKNRFQDSEQKYYLPDGKHHKSEIYQKGQLIRILIFDENETYVFDQ
jgi:hypothetical protein